MTGRTDTTAGLSSEAKVLASTLMSAQEAPYVDRLRRMSGLSEDGFARASAELLGLCLVYRVSAPKGALLYPTHRGVDTLL